MPGISVCRKRLHKILRERTAFLCADIFHGCTWLDPDSYSVQEKNRKISWYTYQLGDVTGEDRARPCILALNFEQVAGLKLQVECSDWILFIPLYVDNRGAKVIPL
jgi:hypothetical protein